MSAAVADHFGLSANFQLFAALNLFGAALAFAVLQRATPLVAESPEGSGLVQHLRNPALRAAFAIGFLILFAFIGTFTYVNFVLVRAPLAVRPMQIGLVYCVFLPAILTTPLAGHAVTRLGTRRTFWAALTLAAVGLPFLLTPSLAAVLAGLTLVGAGTFFAQAVATGFVGRAATGDRGSAGGLYLASYFLGGLAGSFVLGQLFDRVGWPACVAGIGAALALAALLAFRLAHGRAMEKHPWHTGQEHEQAQVS